VHQGFCGLRSELSSILQRYVNKYTNPYLRLE